MEPNFVIRHSACWRKLTENYAINVALVEKEKYTPTSFENYVM
jgi:hypothetical protein